MKKNSEEYIQIYLVSFLKKLQEATGRTFLVWHTPNGGGRNKAEAGRFKLMGVLPGVPDLCIMGPNNHLFFIELKLETGTASKVQKEFIDKAGAFGFKTYIVYAEDIKSAINQVGIIMMEELAIPYQVISSISSTIND